MHVVTMCFHVGSSSSCALPCLSVWLALPGRSYGALARASWRELNEALAFMRLLWGRVFGF